MDSQQLYVPEAILNWARERAAQRAQKNWAQADLLRDRIAAAGYVVRDGPDGFDFERPTIDAPEDIPSNLEADSTLDWTVIVVTRDRIVDLTRCVKSVIKQGEGHALEVIVMGNGDPATHDTMADLAAAHETVRPLYTARELGEGNSLGAALRAARGQYVLIVGVHVELTGDPFERLAATLADPSIGVTGGWGAVTGDLMSYRASDGPEVDAIEFYLFAFRRALLGEVGLPDPRYHFYRNLDLDWSLAFKDKGYRLVLTADLPATTHEHVWQRTDPAEGERLSKKNYRYLLEKWRGRTDLLVSSRQQGAS